MKDRNTAFERGHTRVSATPAMLRKRGKDGLKEAIKRAQARTEFRAFRDIQGEKLNAWNSVNCLVTLVSGFRVVWAGLFRLLWEV